MDDGLDDVAGLRSKMAHRGLPAKKSKANNLRRQAASFVPDLTIASHGGYSISLTNHTPRNGVGARCKGSYMQRRSPKPDSRERMRRRTSLSGGKPGQQGRSKCRYRGCQFTYVRPSIGRHSSSSEDNYDASDEVEEAHGKKGLTRCREQKPRYGGRGGRWPLLRPL